MKTSTFHQSPLKKGVTLIEMTIVIALVLMLVTGAFLSVGYYQNWQKGLSAGEDIKKVYSAQRQYLAENPTKIVADLKDDDIKPFMPDGTGVFPTVEGLGGEALTIDITVSPPVYKNGGTVYDPSGSSTDNLWDAGK